MNTHAKLSSAIALAAITGMVGCSAGLKLNAGGAPSHGSQPVAHAESPATRTASPSSTSRPSSGRVGAAPAAKATMPDVRGLSQDEATARLRDAGLTGKIRLEPMPNCPADAPYTFGQVCDVYPRIGATAPKGFTITLTLQHRKVAPEPAEAL